MNYSDRDVAGYIAIRKGIPVETARKQLLKHPDLRAAITQHMAQLGIRPATAPPPKPRVIPETYGNIAIESGRLWVRTCIMGAQWLWCPENIEAVGHIPPMDTVWVPATAVFSETGLLVRVDIDEPFRRSTYNKTIPPSQRNHTNRFPAGAEYGDTLYPKLDEVYAAHPRGEDAAGNPLPASPTFSQHKLGHYNDQWSNAQIDVVRDALEAGVWRYADGAWTADN